MRSVVVSAAILLLAGCSSSDGGDAVVAETTAAPVTSTTAPASTTTETPTTTTEPATTTTMSIEERGKVAYFVISADFNAEVLGVCEPYGDDCSIPWKDWPGYCARMAKAEEKFANDLTASMEWPADAQDEIDALAAASAASAGVLYKCADSSVEQIQGMQDELDAVSEAAGQAASAARLALGLPIDR